MKRALLAATAVAALSSLAHAEMATYVVDPTHTFVTYEASHFGTSTSRGRFDKKEGTVQLDRAAKTGRVEITFQTASINTGTEAFNNHLKSPDFFDVEKYPTAKFVGDKFSFNGDKVSEVAGTLTLNGKTLPLTLKALNFNCYQNPMLKREVCGGDFDATIIRSQYGITFGLQYGFPDAVHMVIQVEAIKQ